MSLTLEHVKSEFAHWRLTRKSKKHIPEHLINMLRQLLPHYKKTKICRELSLSGAQLKKFIAQTDKNVFIPNDGFIAATLPSVLPMCELSITGNRKTLTVKFSTEQLQHLLPLMVAQL